MSDDRPPDVEIVLAGDAPVTVAGAAVRAAALAAGLVERRAGRLEVVVQQLLVESRTREAVSGETGSHVEVRRDDRSVEVVLRDRRLPLDLEEHRRAGSRRLAHFGFVDHLEVAAEGESGNVARCTVHLDEEVLHRTATGGDVEVLDDAAPRVDDEVAASVVIRPMAAQDAVGVARCVYRCYGYSYLDPTMYRPQQLQRALDSGVVRSLVAVTGSGEVVGHIALTYQHVDDRVPEGGKLVVDPRFRGHHLADRLGRARLDWAREVGLPGIWVECVTNHEFSQHEVLGLGAAETGFLVGAQPATVHMEAVANAVEGRHSLLAMYLPVSSTPPGALHAPERHADLLAVIVDRLGLDRTITTTVVPPSAATTASVLTLSPSAGLAEVRVDCIGADLADHLADQLESLAALDLAAVHLDLPADDPSAAWAADEAEHLGWFLGAWLPCVSPSGDVVRLQRLAGRPVDNVHVVCARPEGEAVRDHVLAEWRRVVRGLP